MTSTRRYAWIGLFIVGALLIAAVSAALFFGGGFGRSKVRAIMVFRGNVTGLELGTPVQFRGMKIGEVRRVRTIYDPDSKQVLFPVYAEFTGIIEIPGYDSRASTDSIRTAWLAEMVERGLRAQLQTKSFVTGQQMIMLDFVTDGGPQFSSIEKNLLEIPTTRSPNETLADALRELPVRDIVFEGQRLITQLNKLMTNGDGSAGALPKMLQQFTATGESLQKSLPLLTSEIGSTTRELKSTLAQSRSSLTAFGQASTSVDKQAVRAVEGLSTTLAEIQTLSRSLQNNANQTERQLNQSLASISSRLNDSLERLDKSMARLDFSLSEDSALGSGLNHSLSEAAQAAQALRQAVDSLQRRPNQLLFGHSPDAGAASRR
jgi:paraquat-inducible protein B